MVFLIKIKALPAYGQIIVYKNYSSSTKLFNPLLLKEVSLKANFTSKLPLFRKTIDYDNYPYFLFSSNIENPVIINDSRKIHLNGYLTFHGVSKKVTIKLKSKSNNNSIIFRGYLNIKMTDFGIKPPKILFIPIDNAIKTKFELYIPITYCIP